MNDALAVGHASAQLALDFANREVNDWEILAIGWVRQYARRHDVLTTGKVRDYAEQHGFREAREARAWGAIMPKAAKQRIIEATHVWVTTERKRSHGRPERIWKSLICQ